MIRMCPFGPHYLNGEFKAIVNHAIGCVGAFHQSIPWAERFVGPCSDADDIRMQLATQREPEQLNPHYKIIDVV